MSWIDDAERRYAALKNRIAAIQEHETALYDSLWIELRKRVAEAREKNARFGGLLTNGQQLCSGDSVVR